MYICKPLYACLATLFAGHVLISEVNYANHRMSLGMELTRAENIRHRFCYLCMRYQFVVCQTSLLGIPPLWPVNDQTPDGLTSTIPAI